MSAVALLFVTGPLLPATAFPEPPLGPKQLPNLIPLPPFDIHIGCADDTPCHWIWDGNQWHPQVTTPALRFSAAALNNGQWAFDLLGIPREVSFEAAADAHQCIRWITRQLCAEREHIGDLVWHPHHDHFHFDDFATYELRALDSHGLPDWTPQGLVSGGEKVSFCLMNSESHQDPQPGPYGQPNPDEITNPFYWQCTSFNQGISPGWADVYPHALWGQQVLTQHVPDGTYALVVHLDPLQIIQQTSHNDTTSYRLIELSEDGTKVNIL